MGKGCAAAVLSVENSISPERLQFGNHIRISRLYIAHHWKQVIRSFFFF